MQPLGGSQLRCPGQSLWSLITEHVPGSELPKIHSALGSSLVDMYTEVHTEAEMWHKMWRESQPGTGGSRAGTPLPRQQASLLADPPAVKELVRAEVKMLLHTLRERAGGAGRVAEELLFRYKPETVDYALSLLHAGYRSPGDAESRSRPGSRCSVQSNAEDEIEATRDELNVTGVDRVVERLRSFLMEECDALNRLVTHFKGIIKQRLQSPCELDALEPSLAELRELRGAIQTDLELYPSSLAASASFPLKELKEHRFRPGQRVSDDTPVFRPHPPPPRSHPQPRPPPGAPPSQGSASAKAINSPSLSRIRRGASASTGPRRTQAPLCDGITASAHPNPGGAASLPGPDSDETAVRTGRPESPSFRTKNSRIHGERDLSQVGGKSRPFWRSRNINAVPSSPRWDAGSGSTGRSVGTTGTHTGRLASTPVQTAGDRRSHLGKDVTDRRSLAATCTRAATVTMNGHLFTPPKRPQETGVPETELEFKCYQPVPPPRVST